MPASGAAVSDEFRRAVALLKPNRPNRTLVSTVGPARVDEFVTADPEHWVRQFREPIRFDRSLATALAGDGHAVVVDVGPAGGLGAAIRESVGDQARAVVRAARQTEDVSELAAFGLALGQLWSAGVPIAWDAWPRRATRRTTLPVPPLARTLYGPDAPVQSPSGRPTRVALWGRGWRRCVHLAVRPERRRIAVLPGADPVGTALAQELTRRGHEVEVVSPELDLTGAADLVVDARAPGMTDGPAAIAAFLALAAQTPVAGRLVVLTRGAFDIVGTESPSTAAAAVAAAALVISQESGVARVTCLDLDDGPVEIDLLARALLREPMDGVSSALRGRSVWRPTVEEIEHTSAPEQTAAVAVITGGLGRFGRQVGRWLAEHGCRELFLIGRTGLDSATPERDHRVEAVAAMRAAGTRVTVVPVDLTDSAATVQVLDQAHRTASGPVTIFHLAGEPNAASAGAPLDDLVRRGLRSALDEQWAAKVSGAETLLRWTRQHPETRCVTFSSNAALLGGPGLAAYAAANAALDAIAVQAREREGLDWCSIGWDGWRLPEDSSDLAASALEEFALRGDEPWQALWSAVGSGHGQLAVAKGDLPARHRVWVENPPDSGFSPATAPPVTVVSVDPDDVITVIRRIWADVLGRPAPHDDVDLFNDGGDSLVAMRIRSRMHRDLNAAVALRDVLENRTVAGLAALVREFAYPAPTTGRPSTPPETIRGRI